MREFLTESAYFGAVLTLAAFEIGKHVKKKYRLGVLNPILIATVLIIGVLVFLKADYGQYNEGARYISYLLTPATVCLAVPLYEKLELLKRYPGAILGGILAGVLTSLGSVLVFAFLFGFTHEQYVTLLPKSITTAIGMGISEELGGMTAITAAVIIITGVLGNMTAELVLRLFHIEDPIAKGIAIGSSSHAIGTAKAMEIGEVEGAMSSLAIAVTGLLTVIGVSVFADFL